ncbi:14096_t:CDS:1, partial [Racocetra persica]
NFEHHWVQFIAFLELFPKASHYVLEILYSTYHSWAIYYIQTCFTAGIQSTQRIESINGIIKKEVSHSTMLLHLVDIIQNRLNK